MTAKPDQATWDVQLRPHLTPYVAYAAAFVLVAAHVVIGLLLKIGSTGVIFQTSDQIAMAGLGLVLAGLVLLFARPRLRVGAAGLSVRNVLSDRLVPWDDVVGVSFPVGARWARIDLPDDEYIPLMAIQSVDKDRAVAAMDTVRSLLARYRPDLPSRRERVSTSASEDESPLSGMAAVARGGALPASVDEFRVRLRIRESVTSDDTGMRCCAVLRLSAAQRGLRLRYAWRCAGCRVYAYSLPALRLSRSHGISRRACDRGARLPVRPRRVDARPLDGR